MTRSHLTNGIVVVFCFSSMGARDGPYRRAVGSARPSDPRPSAACGRQGPPLAGPPGRAQRRPLDLAHRRPLARPARRTLPALPDLPPPFPAVARGGGAGGGSSGSGRGPQGAGRPRPLGVLRRRHLRWGEKGGRQVGKTERGKGTKLVALADRSGLPLPVSTASASGHEVTS